MCQNARRVYELGFEAFRSDNADGNYPATNAQVTSGSPAYVKAAGGSSASESGTPSVAVVKGKGWTFTITYGAAVTAPGVGSAATPAFSAFTPAGCVN